MKLHRGVCNYYLGVQPITSSKIADSVVDGGRKERDKTKCNLEISRKFTKSLESIPLISPNTSYIICLPQQPSILKRISPITLDLIRNEKGTAKMDTYPFSTCDIQQRHQKLYQYTVNTVSS